MHNVILGLSTIVYAFCHLFYTFKYQTIILLSELPLANILSILFKHKHIIESWWPSKVYSQ